MHPQTHAEAVTAARRDEARPAPEPARPFVTSLARGLAVLEAFRHGEELLGNQTIATRTGLPNPTVARLTHTLVSLGYLTYRRGERKYALAPPTLALGFAVQRHNRLRPRLHPALERLARRMQGVVLLATVSRLSMICVDCSAAVAAPSAWMRPGARLPLFDSAPGRLLAAALPAAERAALLARARREDPGIWPGLEGEMTAIVRSGAGRGFFVTEEALAGGFVGVATPVAGPTETSSCVLAAFVPLPGQGVSPIQGICHPAGPAQAQLRELLLLEAGPACLEAAREVSTELLSGVVDRRKSRAGATGASRRPETTCNRSSTHAL